MSCLAWHALPRIDVSGFIYAQIDIQVTWILSQILLLRSFYCTTINQTNFLCFHTTLPLFWEGEICHLKHKYETEKSKSLCTFGKKGWQLFCTPLLGRVVKNDPCRRTKAREKWIAIERNGNDVFLQFAFDLFVKHVHSYVYV